MCFFFSFLLLIFLWYTFYCMFSRFHIIRNIVQKNTLLVYKVQRSRESITHQFSECLLYAVKLILPLYQLSLSWSIRSTRLPLSLAFYFLLYYVLPNTMYDSIRIFFFFSEILLKIFLSELNCTICEVKYFIEFSDL